MSSCWTWNVVSLTSNDSENLTLPRWEERKVLWKRSLKWNYFGSQVIYFLPEKCSRTSSFCPVSLIMKPCCIILFYMTNSIPNMFKFAISHIYVFDHDVIEFPFFPKTSNTKTLLTRNPFHVIFYLTNVLGTESASLIDNFNRRHTHTIRNALHCKATEFLTTEKLMSSVDTMWQPQKSGIVLREFELFSSCIINDMEQWKFNRNYQTSMNAWRGGVVNEGEIRDNYDLHTWISRWSDTYDRRTVLSRHMT